MSSLKNYSKKEQEAIHDIPQLIGLSMSSAAFSGVEGTLRELQSSIETMASGKLLFPDNHLIDSVLPKADTQEALIEKLKTKQQELISKNYIKDLFDVDVFQKRVLKQLEEIIYVISRNEKAYVVSEYKKWILSIAEQVAVSAIEDTVFADDSTDPFSQKEKTFFQKIKKIIMKL